MMLRILSLLTVLSIVQVHVLAKEQLKDACNRNGACGSMNLKHVPQIYPTIEDFNLCENNIQRIESTSFKGYNHLKYLRLCKNSISTIDNASFYHLPNLQFLDLSNNMLTSFDIVQLVKNPLSTLNLGNNPLNHFSDSDNIISYLYLHNTTLSRIPKTEVYNLHTLNLTSTNIKQYATEDIVPFCMLQTFSVSSAINPKIEVLPNNCSCVRFNNWWNSTKVSYGRINMKPLRKSCNGVVKCTDGPTTYSEETVELAEKCFEMREVHNKPCNQWKENGQQKADCTYRSLKFVPFNLVINVTNLNLRNNSFTKIGKASFKRYQELSFLDLSENHIEFIDSEAFQGLEKLKVLNLKRNSLKRICTNLPKSLDTLNLSFNDISNLTCDFPRPNKVKIILLDNNKITKWEKSFTQNFPNVEMLDMHSNGMTDIEEGIFEGLVNLGHLLLQNNSLLTFQHFVPKLRTLNLESNPLVQADFRNSSITNLNLQKTMMDGLTNLYRIAVDLKSLNLTSANENITVNGNYSLCASFELQLSKSITDEVKELCECSNSEEINVIVFDGACNKTQEFCERMNRYVSSNANYLKKTCDIKKSLNRSELSTEVNGFESSTEFPSTNSSTPSTLKTDSTTIKIIDTTISQSNITNKYRPDVVPNSTPILFDSKINASALNNDKSTFILSITLKAAKNRTSSNIVSLSTSLLIVMLLCFQL